MTQPRRSPPRALTRLLEDIGSETSAPGDSGSHSREEVLARRVWDYINVGHVTLDDGTVLKASSREWITALKWLYGQIDGAPKAVPTDSDEGGVIRMEWVDPFDDQNEDDPDVQTFPDL